MIKITKKNEREKRRKRKGKLGFESKGDFQKEKFYIYKKERGGQFWKKEEKTR